MANFTEEMIEKVWAKASGTDANWRKDECGAWIYRSSYGQTTDGGWEVDHITPKSKGGSDALSNLRPLHWKNNRAKSDGRLVCVLRAVGTENRPVG